MTSQRRPEERAHDPSRNARRARASGWVSRPVKEEVRRNAVRPHRRGPPARRGVLGYEDTVLPQLENALLAGHDVIFLGERGQAKTRMIRALAGAARRVDADRRRAARSTTTRTTRSRTHARDLVAERGDDTPIEWVHRDRRFGEKLATPDTSIADLIGEVDPIKVAEGRYLSDELTIHYGLVPRTNRGIFAINELPDLAERIQVGLLNVLEERDVQIRGYKIRLPLDVMLVASANPEDYTNRGRIITPLKDRFGAQIRTHYPLDDRARDGDHRPGGAPARPPTASTCTVPDFMTEIVAEISQQARRSPHVNQRSGVSVRLSIANYETLVANADAARAAPRRARGRAARQRPRRARRVDRGQDRDRDARRRSRGAGARPHREGGDARGVPGARPAREARPTSSPRSRTAWSCTPARTSPSAEYAEAARPTSPALRAAARRPRRGRDAGRRRVGASSSCSRACTSRSGSTRTPSADAAAYRGRG